jgi:uncharacterized membrane protein YvbJ
LVYCSNCGAQIDDEALFCSKCGTKTLKGKEANVPYPSDELKDAFYRVGIELEKAFTIAAQETRAAFKRAREDTQENPESAKTTQEGTVVCSKCGTKNFSDPIFCHNCGTRISD